jgi:LmbE family N-acetylglucosaminyl deacetylase
VPAGRKLSAFLKPRIPDALWPALLTARSVGTSLGGDAVRIGLPPFRRVLVLAPHPDDETLGCGGTIARLADAGRQVVVAVATDGEATKGSAKSEAVTAALRRDETAAAVRILGAEGPRFLSLPDGGLADRVDDLAAAVTALIDELEPEAIFLPWFLDGHADHRALSDAVLAAGPGDVELWGYETHTALVPNRVVDITTVVDRKRRAIEAHATAGLAFELDTALGLNRWRSIHGLMGRGHAEAFLALSAADYRALASA